MHKTTINHKIVGIGEIKPNISAVATAALTSHLHTIPTKCWSYLLFDFNFKALSSQIGQFQWQCAYLPLGPSETRKTLLYIKFWLIINTANNNVVSILNLIFD